MTLHLLLLPLLVRAARPVPLPQRLSYSVPEEFSAPLELPQQHFGLVDDYGIKPKHPHLPTQAQRKQPAGLSRAHKSKRDEPDMAEYYYDDRL